MKIFIVAHNQDLILKFKQDYYDYTDYQFILVGKNPLQYVGHKYVTLIPAFNDDNIERYPKLLTFTAWYFLAKNYLFGDDDYVGIFEYDIKIHKPLSELESLLQPDVIISFSELSVNHPYSFNKTDGLKDAIRKIYHIDFDEIILNNYQDTADNLWAPTTNHIMPVKFLKGFVDWYMKLIPEIFQYPNYPHFHERALKIYSILNGYHNIYKPEYLTHEQLGSHRIPLFEGQYR
jgi:hypothetical protein